MFSYQFPRLFQWSISYDQSGAHDTPGYLIFMRIDGFLLHLVLFAQKPILGRGVEAAADVAALPLAWLAHHDSMVAAQLGWEDYPQNWHRQGKECVCCLTNKETRLVDRLGGTGCIQYVHPNPFRPPAIPVLYYLPVRYRPQGFGYTGLVLWSGAWLWMPRYGTEHGSSQRLERFHSSLTQLPLQNSWRRMKLLRWIKESPAWLDKMREPDVHKDLGIKHTHLYTKKAKHCRREVWLCPEVVG